MDEHINQKGFAFTPTTKKMPLLQKKCKIVFLQNTNYKCKYQLYKKVLKNKIYNNFFFKSILQLESLNIIIYLKKQLKKQIKEPNKYEQCNCRKIVPSHKPCMLLKESVS